MLRFFVLLRALRRDIAVLLFAMLRHDTPRAVKFLFPLTLLYLVSPIDLVPDTIPLLGAVDDMVVLPAATALLVRMLPVQVRAEGEQSVARYGTLILVVASLVLILWLILLVWALSKVFA
ncbi:MAG: YkvA family protein [Selenomonas massiliensis]